jgi:hypothetical protein
MYLGWLPTAGSVGLSCPVLIGLSLMWSGAAQSAHAGGSTTVPRHEADVGDAGQQLG